MLPKELELLIIAVGVEIRAGRIQANADQLDKPARQTPGLRVVFIFTHVAAHVGCICSVATFPPHSLRIWIRDLGSCLNGS